MGDKAATMMEGLNWAGTFHAFGARLLRDQALEIGLDPALTIHDREDSADLMDLVRHELWPAAGFVDTRLRCLTELESGNAEKEVQPRVQA
jgi:superfamily I DNA/RNA helicase